MSTLSANPLVFLIGGLVASALMVLAGIEEKRFVRRSTECSVCHHPRSACTCRWL